jgi:hypothetical protein
MITITFDGITEKELNDIIDKVNNHNGARHALMDKDEEVELMALALAKKKAEEAQRKQELDEFLQLVREAKAGRSDLKPNGGYLKIGRFAFQMTQDVWDHVG